MISDISDARQAIRDAFHPYTSSSMQRADAVIRDAVAQLGEECWTELEDLARDQARRAEGREL